jgi:hypothetical protein
MYFSAVEKCFLKVAPSIEIDIYSALLSSCYYYKYVCARTYVRMILRNYVMQIRVGY